MSAPATSPGSPATSCASPGATALAMMTAGRPPARARSSSPASRSSSSSCTASPGSRCASSPAPATIRRQGDARHRHRQRLPVLVGDAVAGDGIGDARLLCALRPRPDPLLAGAVAARLRRAHRRHRRRSPWRSWRCLLAGPFINVLASPAARAGSPPMACSPPLGAIAAGARRGADRRALPHDRAQAHAPRRADRRGGRRRRLRHRHPGRRRSSPTATLSRLDASSLRTASSRSAPGLDSPLWLPARAAMGDLAALLPVVLPSALVAARARHRGLLRPLRRARHRRRRRRPWRGARSTGAHGVPPRHRRGGAAAQGMDAAAPRSLAAVADADADPLPAAAGAAALAQLRRRAPAPRRAGAGAGHGRRPARRRPRLARHLRRGRARPRRHRAGRRRAACCAPRSRRCCRRSRWSSRRSCWRSPDRSRSQARWSPRRHSSRSPASATAIQLWFRAQAKRSHFRRRQTSSRIATFAEAFSSIGWAGTAALAASGMWQAAVTAVLTLGVLAVARLISPHRARRL